MKIRTFLPFFLCLAVAIAIIGCGEKSSPAEREALVKQSMEQTQESVATRIKYIHDPRTGLCFAYFWEEYGAGTSSVGGPALATVPCNAVQKLLAPSQQSELGNK